VTSSMTAAGRLRVSILTTGGAGCKVIWAPIPWVAAGGSLAPSPGPLLEARVLVVLLPPTTAKGRPARRSGSGGPGGRSRDRIDSSASLSLVSMMRQFALAAGLRVVLGFTSLTPHVRLDGKQVGGELASSSRNTPTCAMSSPTLPRTERHRSASEVTRLMRSSPPIR